MRTPKDPAVSIIVPVFNAKEYLNDTLKYIQAQYFNDYEIIIVDDGSTDASGDWLDSYAKDHEGLYKISVFHQENKGIWRARLKGISMAKGKYIAFCDADDTPTPYWLSTMVDRLERTGSDFVVSAYTQNGKILMDTFGTVEFSGEDMKHILPYINGALWNKMFRKDILSDIPYIKNPPKSMVDMLMMAYIYPKVIKFATIKESLYHYTSHSNSSPLTVDAEEAELIHENMRLLRDYYYSASGSSTVNANVQMCDEIALLQLGVNLTIRRVNSGESIENAFAKEKTLLDSKFPFWKQAGMGFFWNLSHKKVAMAGWKAKTYFKLGMGKNLIKSEMKRLAKENGQ